MRVPCSKKGALLQSAAMGAHGMARKHAFESAVAKVPAWLLWLSMLQVVLGLLSPARGADVIREELPSLFPQLAGELRLDKSRGAPPAHEVRRDGALVGYAFSTGSVTGSVGFSGKPIDIHVGLGLDGRIAGAHLAAHEEPIFVIGVSADALESFVRGLAGFDIRQPVSALTKRKPGGPDHVTGATVSSAVIKDAVLRAARSVAASRGLLAGATAGQAAIDRSTFVPMGFGDLVEAGGVMRRLVTTGDMAGPTDPAGAAGASVLIDIYVALLTPPAIGQNLLGRREFERLQAKLGANQHAVLIAASGLYSFKGTGWRQSGTFDRVQLVQGATTIRLSTADHDNAEALAADGAPDLREIGVFRIPTTVAFDPTQPWRLELIVEGTVAGTRSGAARIVTVEYRIPARFLASPQGGPNRDARATTVDRASPAGTAQSLPGTPPELAVQAPATDEAIPELWEQIWRARTLEIVLVAAQVFALTVILFFHDLLVRDVTRYRRVRIAFLAVTVLFLGIYAGAQLSVVHVVTFAHALLSGFRWEQFLLDPVIFVLWSFVALALLFWGRGVFCGWLCPFGALQELLNEAARKLGVRQIAIPWGLHERLWPIKYVAFLLILGISLKSSLLAYRMAEVEPFKTVMALNFMRAWPFVLYALGLLVAGLFIERIFCRYLCPLGAALAIPARLRLFEWLKRRPQCGRECRVCAARCTVQAIAPLGNIVPNECIYCLQCQANYHDAQTCLPLIQRAQRRAAKPVSPSTPASPAGDGDA